MAIAEITRRDLLRKGAAAAAVGGATLAVPGLAGAVVSHGSEQIGEIYELQAAFHRAKTSQNLDLMMSLWAEDGTLRNEGDANSPYVGSEALRGFWQRSGSFTHRRLSLVPSFKTTIDVHGDDAFLYFECHDIGDYDLATRFIAADLFLAGAVRNIAGSWVFYDMTAGTSSPLSFDHYYYPSPAVIARV